LSKKRARLWRRLQVERMRGRAYQPGFQHRQVLASWLGALLAITALGLISAWSRYGLVVAPFGASTVLLFGHPESPLAQPRNMVLGNSLAAVLSGSLLLLALALLFHRLPPRPTPYPHHWL